MHPLTRALLSGWEWRPEVLVVLVPLAVLYTLGWRRLRRRSLYGKLATWPKLAAYLGGMLILAAALLSPIDRLGSQLFFMHMIQHMLVIMYAAPLLLLAGPFPFILWSLPENLRVRVGGFFVHDTPVRRLLATVTRPGVTWLVFITVYLGWHDSNAYNAALYLDWVHDIEHITFLVAALLYWWPIVGPAPLVGPRLPAWGKMGYLLGTIPPNMFVGVSIAFSSEVLYTYYLSAPRVWGFTVMQDQQLSGAIMWIQGSEMYIIAALIILAGLFRKRETPHSAPPHPRSGSTLAGPGASLLT
jgi:putative membrane protein